MLSLCDYQEVAWNLQGALLASPCWNNSLMPGTLERRAWGLEGVTRKPQAYVYS